MQHQERDDRPGRASAERSPQYQHQARDRPVPPRVETRQKLRRIRLRQRDEHVDRQSTLALFDAFASKEKTLHANPGDHRTIRWIGVDNEFLALHLGQAGTSPA
jgi:hypothetical protein